MNKKLLVGVSLLFVFLIVLAARTILPRFMNRSCLEAHAYQIDSTDFTVFTSNQLQNLRQIVDYPLNDYVVSHDVEFTPDNQTLAISGIGGVGEPGYIKIWYLSEGCFRRIGGVNDIGAAFISFSHDSHLMLVNQCVINNCYRIVSVVAGEESREFEYAEFVAFPEQEFVSYTASGNQDRLLWNPNTFSDVNLSTNWLQNARGFSPDDQLFVTTSSDADIQVWDINTGLQVTQLTGSRKSDFQTESIRRLIFSPDSRWVASHSAGEQVRVWNARNGTLQIFPTDESVIINDFAFTEDSRHFLYGKHVWDVEAGEIAFDLDGTFFEELSPDGSFFVSISDNRVDFWDANTFEHLHHLEFQNEYVSDVSISEDGKLIAIATWEDDCGEYRCMDASGSVEIWAVPVSSFLE